jgi:hypothetical protein
MNKFAVIIPTHGRPDRVYTHKSLRVSGYTGDIYLLCDDDDKTLPQYQELYGDKVLVFSKRDYAGKFDKMDNFGNMACVVYARNAIWDFANKLGLEYFSVADDDYIAFDFRKDSQGRYKTANRKIKNLDEVFSVYVDFARVAKMDAVCFAQGGDYIGGENGKVVRGYSRKMMNLYFFDSKKPLEFKGTINEDLTSSITEGVAGKKILTVYFNSIEQKATQSNAGGLTEIYLELGTYVKSFYSVIAAPSCVKVSLMGVNALRLHHSVNWGSAIPVIIRESVK